MIVPGERAKLIWTKQDSCWEKPAPIDSDHWQSSFEVAGKLVDALMKLGGGRIEDDPIVTGGAQVTRNLTRQVLPH